jgi:hypothetical protein
MRCYFLQDISRRLRMAGHNLLFWLIVVGVAALLVMLFTSLEGMHLTATGGPGSVIW